MTNKIVLKKSAVSGKVPLSADLDYGELAINYVDGKLYYKNSSNTIEAIPSASATETLTNKTLSSPTLSGNTNITGDFIVTNSSSGDEGGEIKLATATTNSSLAAGTVSIDIFQNKVRIFETGGTNRGVYIDLTAAETMVGSNLLTGGGGGTIGSLNVFLRSGSKIALAFSNNILPVIARSGTVNVLI